MCTPSLIRTALGNFLNSRARAETGGKISNPTTCSPVPPAQELGTSNIMCRPVQSLREAVLSSFRRRNDPGPGPNGNLCDDNMPESGPVGGTEMVPQDMMENMLSHLDRVIEDETKNPRRRDNMKIGREFIVKHGWPTKDYCIWVLRGVVLILTEPQLYALPESPERADAFLVVSSPEPGLLLYNCIFSSGQLLRLATGQDPAGMGHRSLLLRVWEQKMDGGPGQRGRSLG